MQERNIASDGQVSGGALVTVPASVVDWLRRAAYAEIGSAAEALDTAAFASDREDHPEWFRGPMQNLREVYALLDAIGWAKTLPPLGVQLDLSEDSWGLMRVLGSALGVRRRGHQRDSVQHGRARRTTRPRAQAQHGGRAGRGAL